MSATLEPRIQVLKYDEVVEKAYQDYIGQLPLDLKDTKKSSDTKSWRQYNRYDLSEFSRQLSRLTQAFSLDDYIQQSQSDFDNAALIIATARKYELIAVDKFGSITNTIKFEFSRDSTLTDIGREMFIPDSNLNQFPCDLKSTKKRVELLEERYPFSSQLRIGIIGDDDFLSLETLNDLWLKPNVIEKDPRILSAIKKAGEYKDLTVHELDIAEPRYEDIEKVQTFITDPPYTLHGALAFICCGLNIVQPRQETQMEFYVILNPTMMGRHFFELQHVLASNGVFLKEIRTNFSHYKLPRNFKERERADAFLTNLGVENHEYSSSSNLYIFTAENPKISEIQKYIKIDKIYQHYL